MSSPGDTRFASADRERAAWWQMLRPGQHLRIAREQLGLTMRQVEEASCGISRRHGNPDFLLNPSRLVDFEKHGVVPSIYRLYSLAIIYRRQFRDLLGWYAISLDHQDADLAITTASVVAADTGFLTPAVTKPPLDYDLDTRTVVVLQGLIGAWGLPPLSYLTRFANHEFTYGQIGSDDFTMDPLLPPGTFILVDESRNKVVPGAWRSQHDRPIYLVETRQGHTCCWCSLDGGKLILQSHILSPVALRILKHPEQAEIIGQVVGIARRLCDQVRGHCPGSWPHPGRPGPTLCDVSSTSCMWALPAETC